MYFIQGLLRRLVYDLVAVHQVVVLPRRIRQPRRDSFESFRLSVLGGNEQRGERLERRHQVVELARLEALIGLRREVVGARLDALVDRASLLASASRHSRSGRGRASPPSPRRAG